MVNTAFKLERNDSTMGILEHGTSAGQHFIYKYVGFSSVLWFVLFGISAAYFEKKQVESFAALGIYLEGHIVGNRLLNNLPTILHWVFFSSGGYLT